VIGAGTMGAGIAAALAAAGLEVKVYDAAGEARERGAATVRAALTDLGKPNAAVTFAADLSALSSSDVFIEAVFEDMATKTAVMRTLGAIARPGAVLATNTSYLDIDALAAAGGRPEQTLGLHFFAPAHRMKLLEVVRGAATSPETLATGLEIARRLGKVAVIAGAGEGFIGNRIFAKYRAQAEYLLEEGASPREIDAAAEALGFAMGPFAVADLSGLDIAWRLRRSRDAARDPRERYVAIPDRVCEAGRLGRKTGGGWYDYPAGSTRGQDSAAVAAIVAATRPERYRGNVVAPGVIRARLLGAIVNEAANALAAGVARHPGDIDVVFVNGYGFSRLLGGPLFQARRMERRDLDAMIDAVAAATGFGFRRGDLSLVLARDS
jgi:3-hydroxyacyl-CoA dehydrogenase